MVNLKNVATVLKCSGLNSSSMAFSTCSIMNFLILAGYCTKHTGELYNDPSDGLSLPDVINSCIRVVKNADSNIENFCGFACTATLSVNFNGIEYPDTVYGFSGSGYP